MEHFFTPRAETLTLHLDDQTSPTPLAPHNALEMLARADQQAHGEHGAYAVATLYHALYLDQARDHLTELQEWLTERARLEPPLNSTLVAYQLHTYLREMVLALHYARHWAMLSASYHHSRAAADAYERITQTIQRAEGLGEQAGRAFLQASHPHIENLSR